VSGERLDYPFGSEKEPVIEPKVWIASLSDYNAGHLHGAWIDADQEPEVIVDAIHTMLATSTQPSAEEWAIFDSEGFSPIQLDEHESIEQVSQIAQGIARYGAAFAAFVNYLGRDERRLWGWFEESYQGRWASVQSYVEDELKLINFIFGFPHGMPDGLHRYLTVDSEALARDMVLDGHLLAIEADSGGVYLFRPRAWGHG
jgi:antirestriction protein